MVESQLCRLERSRQEADARVEGIDKRDMEMTAREKEVAAREKELIAQKAELIAQQAELIAREQEMVAREKEIEEREQSVKMREQVPAKRAKALMQSPISSSRQETTTSSTNDSKQPGITALTASTMVVRQRAAAVSSGIDLATPVAAQAAATNARSRDHAEQPSIAERKSAIPATSEVLRNTDRFSPLAAQAATATAMSQHTQAPRKELLPKMSVQKSNTDESHRLGTFIDNMALFRGKLSLSMQTPRRYANSIRKFYASFKMSTGLTD